MSFEDKWLEWHREWHACRAAQSSADSRVHCNSDVNGKTWLEIADMNRRDFFFWTVRDRRNGGGTKSPLNLYLAVCTASYFNPGTYVPTFAAGELETA